MRTLDGGEILTPSLPTHYVGGVLDQLHGVLVSRVLIHVVLAVTLLKTLCALGAQDLAMWGRGQCQCQRHTIL